MKKKWVVCVACILVLCMTAAVPVFAAGKNAQNDKTDYLDEMTGELDFSKLDHFMGQDAGDGGITFSELVEELLHQENPGTVYQQLGPWLVSQLCESVRENRKILVEVVLLAVCFSVLKNFAGAFASSYVSDICYILVFCVLAVLMMQSFLTFRGIVCGVLEKSVEFFRIFIPTFSIAMVFSAGAGSASGFYQGVSDHISDRVAVSYHSGADDPHIHIDGIYQLFFRGGKICKYDGTDRRTDPVDHPACRDHCAGVKRRAGDRGTGEGQAALRDSRAGNGNDPRDRQCGEWSQ